MSAGRMKYEAAVERAIEDLYPYVHPRGHDLLDALRWTCIEAARLVDDAVVDNQRHSVRADLLGYEPDDPKSDGYHARLSDLADYDRKRRRENV